MPLADHTFSLGSHRDALLAAIEAWARETVLARVPAAAPAPPPLVEAATAS